LLACQQKEAEMTPITNKSAIVGKWSEGDKIVEIFENEKIVYTNRETKDRFLGKYEFVNDGILRVSYSGIGTNDYEAYIAQGRIILKGVNDGLVSQLTRYKE
jgi:hypothetical protein